VPWLQQLIDNIKMNINLRPFSALKAPLCAQKMNILLPGLKTRVYHPNFYQPPSYLCLSVVFEGKGGLAKSL
jgi:hypothetical protein